MISTLCMDEDATVKQLNNFTQLVVKLAVSLRSVLHRFDE